MGNIVSKSPQISSKLSQNELKIFRICEKCDFESIQFGNVVYYISESISTADDAGYMPTIRMTADGGVGVCGGQADAACASA